MLSLSLDFYNVSLHNFMMPILVKVFLPDIELVYGLMLGFVPGLLGLLCKMLGASFLGSIGDKERYLALRIGSIGLSLTTLLIALLPTSSPYSVFFLLFLRLAQGFFLAGRYSGGAIALLEHPSNRSRPAYISSVYSACATVGILTASVVATLCAANLISWRLTYLLGFCAGLLGSRAHSQSSAKSECENSEPIQWKVLANVLPVTIYLAMTYSLPTHFLNAVVPLATPISLREVMLANTITTALNVLMFPLFGMLADAISPVKSMNLAAIAMIPIALSVLPLISFISNLFWLLVIKICLAALCVWFEAPFHAWMQQRMSHSRRYKITSLTYTIGTQLGAASIPLSLFIWHKTHSLHLVGVLFACGAFASVLCTRVSCTNSRSN